MEDSLALTAALREAAVNAEWYPQPARMARQLKYADRQGIPLAAILGPDELSSDAVAIKDLRNGEQKAVSRKLMLEEIERLLGELS